MTQDYLNFRKYYSENFRNKSNYFMLHKIKEYSLTHEEKLYIKNILCNKIRQSIKMEVKNMSKDNLSIEELEEMRKNPKPLSEYSIQKAKEAEQLRIKAQQKEIRERKKKLEEQQIEYNNFMKNSKDKTVQELYIELYNKYSSFSDITVEQHNVKFINNNIEWLIEKDKFDIYKVVNSDSEIMQNKLKVMKLISILAHRIYYRQNEETYKLLDNYYQNETV